MYRRSGRETIELPFRYAVRLWHNGSNTMNDRPRLASSLDHVPHSRIRELAEIAMTMDGVLRLYFGESNLPTPDYIKRAAVRALEEGHTYYTENAGLPSLRAAISVH